MVALLLPLKFFSQYYILEITPKCLAETLWRVAQPHPAVGVGYSVPTSSCTCNSPYVVEMSTDGRNILCLCIL